jgi:hypothetical protein
MPPGSLPPDSSTPNVVPIVDESRGSDLDGGNCLRENGKTTTSHDAGMLIRA